jgi:cell division transport system permease protein
MKHLSYFLKKTADNLWSDRWKASFLLLSLSCPLILFGLFLLFYYNVDYLLHTLRKDVHFSIYLRDAVGDAAGDAAEAGGDDAARRIKAALASDVRIASFSYISKQEALQWFKDAYRDDALLTGLGENPFPASFEVQVKASDRAPAPFKRIVDRYKKMSGVEEVHYTAEWLQELDGFLRLLGRIGGGIGCLLAVAVITIVASAIRLHLHSRAEEVEVMRLMGATHAFIIVPFLLEGSLAGFLGGWFSLLLLFLVVQLANMALVGIPLGPITLRFFPLPFLLGFAIAGAGLGGLGSFVSLRRS